MREDSSYEVRYAPYVETQHQNFLEIVTGARGAIISDSPFAGYENLDANLAFFGFASGSSLYDTFAKCMSGLDLSALWDRTFSSVLSRPEVKEATLKEMRLADDVFADELTAYQVKMRNLNSVGTSTYIVGRSILEKSRVKELARISLEAKISLLPEIGVEFARILNWQKNTVARYAETLKGYFAWKMDTDEANSTFAVRDKLWPFTVMDFEGMALSTMTNTKSWKKSMAARERSATSKVLLVASYTATGAYYGSQISPGWGTVIGAVVGLVVGIAMLFLE